MASTVHELETWMKGKEDEHLEFKEAKSNFDSGKLAKYCAALSNEGGGRVIFGVTNQRPRRVVGTRAFEDLERTKAGLVERLRLRINAEEIVHPEGRVVVFHVPPRPIGMAIHIDGAYWMRAGEDLVPMTPDMLKWIFDEAGPDFSAGICQGASVADLEPAAIEAMRAMWCRKSGNKNLDTLPPDQLLADAELVVDGAVTYAALVLLGTEQVLRRFLPQAEVIFEYRPNERPGPAQQRKEYRRGFFLFHDDLWNTIELRNEVQHFRSGLIVLDIRTFSEIVVREAVLNAISHRDYRLAGSIFVRQYPRRLEIVSPGGFPAGITLENILWRQSPRNRRIAEVLQKCGLIERSGQGVNLMFEEAIKESKPAPDFSDTDEHQVAVAVRGEVQDPQFLQFLEKLGKERLASFQIQDLLVLDAVNRGETVAEGLKDRLPTLVEEGVIERVGRNRYMLSRKFYSFVAKPGVYTRKRGLDRNTNKALLLQHIRDNNGCQLQEMLQVLPALPYDQVRRLLRELKAEGQIHNIGRTRAGRWYFGPSPAPTGESRTDSNEEPRRGR